MLGPVCSLSNFAFATLVGNHFLLSVFILFVCPGYIHLRLVRLSFLVCVSLCNLCACCPSVSQSFVFFWQFIDLILFGLWILFCPCWACLPITGFEAGLFVLKAFCDWLILLDWSYCAASVCKTLFLLFLAQTGRLQSFIHSWCFGDCWVPWVGGGVRVLFSLSLMSKGND